MDRTSTKSLEEGWRVETSTLPRAGGMAILRFLDSFLRAATSAPEPLL
jgi:hypothetical protein